MALPEREVIVFVGDGSYLMMNSDLYSSVLSGHKLIVIVCDNGGFAVINRLQVNQAARRSTTSSPTRRCRRWWRSTSCPCRRHGVPIRERDVRCATWRRRWSGPVSDRTYVIAVPTSAYDWTGGGAFWEVGVPEISGRPAVVAARSDGRRQGRAAVGW